MHIAITCAFPPSIGGIESVADLIASEFVAAGNTVEIIASNPGPGRPPVVRSFPVHYQPTAKECRKIYARSDCVLQFGFGLKVLLPNLFPRRPVVVSHQMIYEKDEMRVRWRDLLKNRIAAHFVNVAASRAVARNLPLGTSVIPNCYDDRLFRFTPTVSAVVKRDVICVARLIPEKGVDILLTALGLLREHGRRPTVTIVGDGPRRENLMTQATRLGLSNYVEFIGSRPREEIPAQFRGHRIAVIPSRYREAFGVVTLEAIASGCRVVVANRGGLPEAAGPAGVMFDPEKPAELASKLAAELDARESGLALSPETATHLATHSPRAASARYLAVLQAALERRHN